MGKRVKQSGGDRKSWRRRPLTWVVAVFLSAIALMMTNGVIDFTSGILGNHASPGAIGERLSNPALGIVDVKRVMYDTGDFVFPNGLTPEQLEALNNSEAGLDETLVKAGKAIEVSRATWEIALQGQRTQPVEIVNIKRQLVGKCHAPVGGTLVENFSAGQTEKIPMIIGVDRQQPVVIQRTYDDNDTPIDTPYFSGHKITIPKGEVVVLVVTGETSGPSCRWNLIVELLADGKRQQLTIDNGDRQPFTVTGRLPAEQYEAVVLSPLRGCGESEDPYKFLSITSQAYARLSDQVPCP